MERERQPWSYSRYGFMASSFITWPPRSYPCSFCKREFRSAQALGGHMNVHRRDRARLRHGSPPPHLPRPAAAVTSPPVPNLNYLPPQCHHHHHPPDDSSKKAASPPPDDSSLRLGLGVLMSSSCTATAAPTTPAAGTEDDDGLDLELRLGVS